MAEQKYKIEYQTQSLEKYKVLRQRREDYCKSHGIHKTKIINMVLPEVINLIKGKSSSTLPLTKTKPWTNEQYYVGMAVLGYMFDNIVRLPPEKIDALWEEDRANNGKNFLESTGTKSLVDKIISESLCNSVERKKFKDCLLDSKKFILKSLYPEYYKATYNEKYNVIDDLVNADEETINNLKLVGKVKTTVTNNRSVQMGNVVDELIYEAFEGNFKARQGIVDFKDKLIFLSNAKQYHLKQMSFIKIMNNRGCYASPLDFYYLNSPKELQDKYFDEYKELRDSTQKKDEITDILNEYENMIYSI